MRNLSQTIIDKIRESLKSFVVYEQAEPMRESLHNWAKLHYKPKNTPDEYMRFINRWIPDFQKVHAQCTNFPYYLSMFTTVSQRVYGDCVEECLDKAIEYEKGKPWFWYVTKEATGDKFKSTFKIYRDKKVDTARVAFNKNYDVFHLGIDKQYFKIPFDRPFNKGDVIVVAGWTGGNMLYIVEEPVHSSIESEGETIYYWDHTVVLYDSKIAAFHPLKYVTKDIIYQKLIA
jgi:hypothetical protein